MNGTCDSGQGLTRGKDADRSDPRRRCPVGPGVGSIRRKAAFAYALAPPRIARHLFIKLAQGCLSRSLVREDVPARAYVGERGRGREGGSKGGGESGKEAKRRNVLTWFDALTNQSGEGVSNLQGDLALVGADGRGADLIEEGSLAVGGTERD